MPPTSTASGTSSCKRAAELQHPHQVGAAHSRRIVSHNLTISDLIPWQTLPRAAEEARLPISTLIRIWAIDRLHVECDGTAGTVGERLTRLEREVFKDTA